METTIMKNPAFTIERTYRAPIARVWKAITDKDEMKEWYFELPEFKTEIGFEFKFVGGPPGGKQYVHHCKVTDVVKGKKLTHSWSYEGYEGISFVTFELFPEGNSTRLKLTHSGLETFPKNNPDLAKEKFAEGWTQIVGTGLVDYLER